MAFFLLTFIILAVSQGTDRVSNATANTWKYCTGSRFGVCFGFSNRVCGAYKSGLPKTFSSACLACRDSGVIAYKPGKCQDIGSTCTPATGIDCRLVRPGLNPSCIFRPSQPFSDATYSLCCQNSSYKFTIVGKCPIIPVPPPKILCKASDRSGNCIDSEPRVCAVKNDQTAKTYRTRCTACTDSAVIGYSIGKCNGTIDEETSFSTCPGINPELWPAEDCTPYDPVCGFRMSGLPTQYSTSCISVVCRGPIAYKKGACSETVRYCRGPRVNCDNAPNIPSCAY